MSEYLKKIFLNLYNCFMEDSALRSSETSDPDVNVSENVNDNDDNWETVDPELIQKRLEERRKEEEADHKLTNELFNENSESKPLFVPPPPPPKTLSKKKEKLKIDVSLINNSYSNRQQAIKNAKKKWKKRKEIFGEAEFDEIDDMSDDIHEKHGNNTLYKINEKQYKETTHL